MGLQTILLRPELRRLITRFLLFTTLFLVVSSILGPWIVSTPLLYTFDFFVYANFGKMILFSSILFLLLTRNRWQLTRIPSFQLSQLLYLVYAVVACMVFYALGNELLTTDSWRENIILFAYTHLTLLSIPILLAVGSFGLETLVQLVRHFWKHILICIGVSVGYFFLIFQVWKLWPLLSNTVLQIVQVAFSSVYDVVIVLPPRGLFVQNFAVEIEESCSGIESIFLFSTLYGIVAVLDWKKLNPWRVLLLFVPAVAGMFIVNIVRVIALIWIGVEVSPELSVQLFHTYLGMVLFIVYFGVFWNVFYGWMERKG